MYPGEILSFRKILRSYTKKPFIGPKIKSTTRLTARPSKAADKLSVAEIPTIKLTLQDFPELSRLRYSNCRLPIKTQ
ncbi:MAG: hypothetical protein KKD18_02270 [Nanoarchaeota archaeon]|nr:hypothetical protein [Nanoarchaeota archaeon]